jgi:hypothetical protein
MPRANSQRFNKNKKRKISKFKNKGSRRRSFVTRNVGYYMPDRLRVRQRVSHLMEPLTMTSGLFYFLCYGNSAFNPGAGNFTLQPIDYQQYMGFYYKYRVLGSSINIKVINITSGAINGMWFALYPSVNSDSGITSYDKAAVQKYSKVSFMGNSVGLSILTLSNSMTSSKIFGANVYNDESYSGDFSNNPDYKWYWVLTGSGVFDDPNYPTFQMEVTISLDVMYYARQSGSLTDAIVLKDENLHTNLIPLKSNSNFNLIDNVVIKSQI